MRIAAALALVMISGPEFDSGSEIITGAIAWNGDPAVVEHAEIPLEVTGEAWRLRLIVARFDPARMDMSLVHRPDPFGRPDRWQVTDAGDDALLAINAGQFDGRGPWGWLVEDGVELAPPGHGPLSAAVVQFTDGSMRMVASDSIDAVRRAGGVGFAIQSYPAVLVGDGEVPSQLLVPGSGVDLVHRDSRTAICELRDGRWLAMLTRFEGLGGRLERLPMGPTTPEMALVAKALGCVRAVLLDGGMSGQMMVRDPSGETMTWEGLRKVPAGIVLRREK